MTRAKKMIFSKSLTETDIKKRLAIPSKILAELPEFNGSHAVKIPLVYGTRVWQIVCSVRKEGYKKPVFSGGWRDFVGCNELHVGDKTTLYKVDEDDGSFHYRLEVQKPARPSRPSHQYRFPLALSVNHEADEIPGTSCGTFSNFEHEKEQLLKADDAPFKEDGDTTEPANAIAIAIVPLIDHHVISAKNKFTGKITDKRFSKSQLGSQDESENLFSGTTVSISETIMHAYYMTENKLTGRITDEVASKAQFKSEDESKNLFSSTRMSITTFMREPQHVYYMTKPFDMNGDMDGGSVAYGTSHYAAAPKACCKSTDTERFSLDLVPPYEGEVNLDLTLALPIVDISIQKGHDEAPQSKPW